MKSTDNKISSYTEKELSDKKIGKQKSTFKELNKVLADYIIYILKKHSSYEHPLSPKDILKYIRKDIDTLFNGAEKYNTTAVTIRNNLNSLYELSNPYGDELNNPYKELFTQLYGGVLIKFYKDPASTRNNVKYIECNEYMDKYGDYEDTENITDSESYYETNEHDSKSNRNTYYYFQSMFTPEEFIIMESCIETNPYLSTDDNRKLAYKLNNVISNDITLNHENKLNALNTFRQRVSNDSARLLKNISLLIQHINANHQIEINYGKYIFNNATRHPELVSKKEHANWQRIDPISVIQANGFYYLIAHTDKSSTADDVISYRVDRIIDIDAHKDAITGKILTINDKDIISYRNSFSAIDYLKTHPVMYSGDKTDIRMLIKETKAFPAINSLIDTFGNNINLYELKDSETRKYLNKTKAELEQKGEHWYMVHLNHSINGTVLWSKQHIENARIISPDTAVKKIVDTVTAGLALYNL